MAVYAKAIFEYEATDADDLTFVEGDIIEVLEQKGEWWRGKTRDGRVGYFPYNRVEKLKSKPGRNGGKGPELVNVRQPQEEVKGVTVLVAEVGRGKKKGLASYNVTVKTKGPPVSGVKTMRDFRCFDKALRMLIPTYDFTCNLSPEWADSVPLSNELANSRAEILTKFLAHNTSNRHVFDLLLLEWARSSNIRPANSKPGAVRGGENRNSVMQKIQKALSFAYVDKNLDACRWFLPGAAKAGDLVQTMYNWVQRDGTELSLSANDYILVSTKETRYDGWWYGQKIDGGKGLFPSNYVKELNEQQLRRRFKNASEKGPPPQMNATTDNFAKLNFKNQQPTMGPPDLNRGNNMMNTAAQPMSNQGGSGRPRKTENGYFVKSIVAYDELKSQGYTLECNGSYSKGANGGPGNGDLVSLSFSAYVWDPQTQQIKEFSSSEKLAAPPRGVQTGDAGASGMKMEFVLGRNTAIEGLESVIRLLAMNQRYRAIIAPAKGYGDVGCPPEIPGNCYLVYDLTLEKVTKGGGGYKPPRNQIFSVGISRPAVMNRGPSVRGAAFQQVPTGGGNSANGRRRKKRTNGGTNYGGPQTFSKDL